MTDFEISSKNDEKPAFMFLFTSIKISNQRKPIYECRFFVIFRTNFKICHDRSIANVPIFLLIYNFPDKNPSPQRNHAKTWCYTPAAFFLIFTAKLAKLSQSVQKYPFKPWSAKSKTNLLQKLTKTGFKNKWIADFNLLLSTRSRVLWI